MQAGPIFLNPLLLYLSHFLWGEYQPSALQMYAKLYLWIRIPVSKITLLMLNPIALSVTSSSCTLSNASSNLPISTTSPARPCRCRMSFESETTCSPSEEFPEHSPTSQLLVLLGSMWTAHGLDSLSSSKFRSSAQRHYILSPC